MADVWKPGDVVRFKAGGPDMVVARLHERAVKDFRPDEQFGSPVGARDLLERPDPSTPYTDPAGRPISLVAFCQWFADGQLREGLFPAESLVAAAVTGRTSGGARGGRRSRG